MILQQRATIADELLLRVILPYLDSHPSKRIRSFTRVASFWSVEAREVRQRNAGASLIEAAAHGVPRLQRVWHRLMQTMATVIS